MLTASKIKGLAPQDKAYTVKDSPNLYLIVNPIGSKLWRCRYTFNGVEKLLSLGKYPAIDVLEARARRDDILKKVAMGIDPAKERLKDKLEQKGKLNFDEMSKQWLVNKAANDDTKAAIQSILNKHILPKFGLRKIDDFSTAEIIDHCRKIESSTSQKRTLTIFQGVFRYSVILGLIPYSPVADVRGVLPPIKHKHHASIIDRYTQRKKREIAVGKLMMEINDSNLAWATKTCLILLAHTFVRSAEIRHMKWEHIDWEHKTWNYTITKTNTPHIVPLSEYVLDVLREVKSKDISNPYVFAHRYRKDDCINENTLVGGLNTIGYHKKHTPHGFRAMSRTILEEYLLYQPHIIETQLGHTIKDANGRAYNRTTHLEERRKMMQEWSNYLVEKEKITREIAKAYYRNKASKAS